MMKKLLLALVLGLAIGYFYGFMDAKKYEKNIVSRAVARVGGKAVGYSTDIDKKMEAAEGR